MRNPKKLVPRRSADPQIPGPEDFADLGPKTSLRDSYGQKHLISKRHLKLLILTLFLGFLSQKYMETVHYLPNRQGLSVYDGVVNGLLYLDEKIFWSILCLLGGTLTLTMYLKRKNFV
jgi:hypothetical protein